jgi:integrase
MGRVVKREMTDRGVKNAPPGYHAVGGSLYLQVTDNGCRSWILRTLVQGRRREMGLGSYPDVSLAEARELASGFRKIARRGGDPFLERDKGKVVVPSFQEAARTVYEAHRAGWKNKKHSAQWLSTMEQYVFPAAGEVPVSQIDTHHVMDALSPIWLTKPETARRVRQRIGLVLDWARAKKYRVGDNPCDNIAGVLPKQLDADKHHEALPYKELAGFIGELREASTSESIKLAFEFLILTAARTGEVLQAKWSEIESEDRAWRIPKTRMKAKKEHRVPLSPRCLEILESARKLGGKTHIFPTPGTDAPLSNMALLMLLRRMGKTFTAHGFRSTFRDWAAETTNFSRQLCEVALAHTIKGVEGDYLRGDLFEKRRKLMEAWAAYANRSSAKIVSLRSA